MKRVITDKRDDSFFTNYMMFNMKPNKPERIISYPVLSGR